MQNRIVRFSEFGGPEVLNIINEEIKENEMNDYSKIKKGDIVKGTYFGEKFSGVVLNNRTTYYWDDELDIKLWRVNHVRTS